MNENIKNGPINKLIIVGNGFDLALGLNTGYSHFLLWLQKKYFLLTIEKGSAVTYEGKSFRGGYLNHSTFEIGIPHNYSNVSFENEIEKIHSLEEFKKFIKSYNITYNHKSNLLKLVLEHNRDLGWVDIENLFYQELKKCIDTKLENIIKINRELDFLSGELEIFLSKIDTLPHDWPNFEGAVKGQLIREVEIRELEDEYLLNSNKVPEIIYFLNFNYTMALYNVTREIEKWVSEGNIRSIWNPIHGQIKNKNAPVIFGFGDETDKDYDKIEDLNNNSFFEHIKSFKYSQTSNYQNLIKFLDSAYYQVCIYGHSCGLSDRTMLKEIFEHGNCKSIKIFYHKRPDGSDDFLEKTMEISRHFSDKASMRRKVVNKEYCQPMPQNLT